MNHLRIIHANENTLARNGLKSLLNRGGGVDHIKAVVSEKQLFDTLSDGSQWDLVILDPHEENGFTLDTIKRLTKEYGQTKVLAISDVGDHDFVLNLLENGTNGYLTYECDEEEIIHAVFAIGKGDKFYCNKVLDIVLNRHLYTKEVENCEPTVLSERESQIAKLLAEGNTNKQVAEQLHISPHTVHSHRKNIMKKLGVRSISELTIYCVSIGLVKT